MTRVLLVGYDPEAVDFSNPAYPPGMSVEKVRAGITLALKQMADRGWENGVCYIRPDGTAEQTGFHQYPFGHSEFVRARLISKYDLICSEFQDLGREKYLNGIFAAACARGNSSNDLCLSNYSPYFFQ